MKALSPVTARQQGLRGRRAKIVVDEPTDELYWPADLPAGTRWVVILDDTPNDFLTLRVHPVGDLGHVAYVAYDQLALPD